MVAANKPTPRRQRGSLTPDEIVTAAVALVEEHGPAGLTMPAVAQAIDAPVTSVYWHFRSKEDLLTAVAERVTADLYASLAPVASEQSWEDELVTYFTAFRQHLLQHHAFLELFRVRSVTLFANATIGKLITGRLEEELGVLVRAGATPQDAYRAYNVFSTYVQGYVTIELGRGREETSPQTAQAIVGRQQALDPALFPVTSTIPDLPALTSSDPDQHFQYGLRLLINGARAALNIPRSGLQTPPARRSQSTHKNRTPISPGE